MGMFDSIYLDIKRPYCGEESESECQTKELDCNLDVFRKGDSIGTDKYNYLNCIGDCHSKECLEYINDKLGYVSGFGRSFDIKVKLTNGIVNGEYEIIRDSE